MLVTYLIMANYIIDIRNNHFFIQTPDEKSDATFNFLNKINYV